MKTKLSTADTLLFIALTGFISILSRCAPADSEGMWMGRPLSRSTSTDFFISSSRAAFFRVITDSSKLSPESFA